MSQKNTLLSTATALSFAWISQTHCSDIDSTQSNRGVDGAKGNGVLTADSHRVKSSWLINHGRTVLDASSDILRSTYGIGQADTAAVLSSAPPAVVGFLLVINDTHLFSETQQRVWCTSNAMFEWIKQTFLARGETWIKLNYISGHMLVYFLIYCLGQSMLVLCKRKVWIFSYITFKAF